MEIGVVQVLHNNDSRQLNAYFEKLVLDHIYNTCSNGLSFKYYIIIFGRGLETYILCLSNKQKLDREGKSLETHANVILEVSMRLGINNNVMPMVINLH